MPDPRDGRGLPLGTILLIAASAALATRTIDVGAVILPCSILASYLAAGGVRRRLDRPT
jgi:hypothetical protein